MERLIWLALPCAMTCATAQAATLSVPIPFPEPAAPAEVGVSVVTRVENRGLGDPKTEALVETPTVIGPLTPGFTSVSGEVDTQVLTRSANAKGGFSNAQTVGSTLVSIPDRSRPVGDDPQPVVSQSPQVQASASANVSGFAGLDTTASVQAQSSLAYYFEIVLGDEMIATSILGDSGTIPVNFGVMAGLSASIDPTSSPNTVASASGTITVSTDPITVNAFGNLDIPVPDDDTLTEDIFQETVFASLSDGIEDSLEPELQSFTVEGDLLPSIPGWLGKTVDASVFIRADEDGGSGSGEATAIVDPVILFDEARFQAQYGARCAALFGGGACPAMESLFSLKMSPFVGNGFPLDDGGVTAPVPLPAGGWLLLAGMGAMALIRARRGAR